MLRQALRRVLWLAPTLALMSLCAFWLLSTATPTATTHAPLPRFLNAAPMDVERLAARLIDDVADGGPEASAAAKELAQRGGATLPYVLPRLDTLAPAARTRVALALAPIAERMGVTRDRDYADPETTLRFWNRFWQDRGIDFRPVAVRRAVQRASAHPSPLRDAEVRAFDTYALDELMGALASAHDSGDIDKIHHLTRLSAHAAGASWTVPKAATPAQVTAVADTWLEWWAAHGHEYVAFHGTSRVYAMISETQYGRFVMNMTRTFTETVRGLWPRARITLGLLACALGLGNALGLLLSLAALGPHVIFGAATAALSVVVLSLPSPLLSETVSAFPLPPFPIAAIVMSLTTASAVAIQERATLRRALAHPSQTTRRAMGISRLVASLRATRASSGPIAARLATEVPLVLTTAFVFEHALGLPGLGEVIVDALRSNDVDLLMLVVLFTTTLVTLVQLLVDVLLGLLAARHVLARRRIGIFQ